MTSKIEFTEDGSCENPLKGTKRRNYCYDEFSLISSPFVSRFLLNVGADNGMKRKRPLFEFLLLFSKRVPIQRTISTGKWCIKKKQLKKVKLANQPLC